MYVDNLQDIQNHWDALSVALEDQFPDLLGQDWEVRADARYKFHTTYHGWKIKFAVQRSTGEWTPYLDGSSCGLPSGTPEKALRDIIGALRADIESYEALKDSLPAK